MRALIMSTHKTLRADGKLPTEPGLQKLSELLPLGANVVPQLLELRHEAACTTPGPDSGWIGKQSQSHICTPSPFLSISSC
jgi:hypothetical protein